MLDRGPRHVDREPNPDEVLLRFDFDHEVFKGDFPSLNAPDSPQGQLEDLVWKRAGIAAVEYAVLGTRVRGGKMDLANDYVDRRRAQGATLGDLEREVQVVKVALEKKTFSHKIT